jgi:branched-chain amino acid transport system ATP-binding protein
VLTITELSKAFEGVKAVQNVSFECRGGEITGVIGPNGAGKTTLFNIVSGINPPDSGQIVFREQDITRTRTHQRVRLGIARTFQNIRLFPDMTALENVMVARHTRTRSQIRHAFFWLPVDRRERMEGRTIGVELLEFVGLSDRPNVLASDLPYGDQRRLEVARALATEPRLLLLDEPSAGMNPTEQSAFTELIRAIGELGISVMLIEHNIPLVMDLCDHVVVLNFGEVIARGTALEARNTPKVIEAYFGTAASTGGSAATVVRPVQESAVLGGAGE